MKKKVLAIVATGVLILSCPLYVQAEVVVGGIRFADDGSMVFNDNSVQSTATLQGPQGPQGLQGPKGDPGTPGSAVTKEAICQAYADNNLPAPAFCGKKIIFITSNRYNGNLGGLAGADQICQTAATTAGLTGTFVAWLSDSTTAAKDRITHSTVPYVRTDGAIIANNWSNLTGGFLKEPILCDENKAYQVDEYSGYYAVWTNTTSRGNLVSSQATNSSCADWTSNSATVNGVYGNSTAVAQDWSYDYGKTCDRLANLYCIEQ